MNLKDILTPQEFDDLVRPDDVRGWWLVACNYAITAGIFAVMAVWPNPLTIVIGTILLGGRQLGFGVLVHECGHGTLFKSKQTNEFVGEWLAAAPTFNNMKSYARGHLAHHRLAGTKDDPDLPNYQDYPITPDRLKRKLWRDVTGQTGWKQTQNIFRGLMNLSRIKPEQRLSLVRGLVYNVAMLALFVAIGAPWLYLLWWVAMLTSNRIVSRLRQVAEHAAVPDLYDLDPRLNTRTIAANWFDRLVFCPLGVSYHLEHHMNARIPIYKLPKLHALLMDKGFYDDVDFPPSYFTMLREVTAPA